MKKSFILLLPLAAIVFLFNSFSNNDIKYPNGASAGYTGSPGDNKNCTFCHNGTASNVQNWISSDVGPEGYIPGNTYNITVTVTGSGNKGFEVSPQNMTGDLLGTLIAGTGSKLVGSGKYVTHTSASSSNPKVWTFQWTAPVAGTGDVTFYGAFALNKSVTKLSTTVIPENVFTGVTEIPVVNNLSIFPNPADPFLGIGFETDISSRVSISIVNVSNGISIQLADEYMTAGQHYKQFDCSSIASGAYILNVEGKNTRRSSKVLISH